MIIKFTNGIFLISMLMDLIESVQRNDITFNIMIF